MQQLEGSTAVVTGAASGIGRAIVERCAAEQMSVVLVDVRTDEIRRAEADLRDAGVPALAMTADVSNAREIDDVASAAVEAFGGVQVLFNNAGLDTHADYVSQTWDVSATDSELIVGVNLLGVIHGIRTFVPLMLAQERDCHVVNTASLAGLASPPSQSVYTATKHGVVALSESLYRQLDGSHIGVSILCPGPVRTGIWDAMSQRPGAGLDAKEIEALRAYRDQAYESAIDSDRVAADVFDAIREDRFYIFTHPEGTKSYLRRRMEDLLATRNPTLPGP